MAKDGMMTRGRRAWLEKLAAEGTVQRGRYEGVAAASCIRAGWSDWVYRIDGGRVVMGAAWWREWQEAGFPATVKECLGEAITDSGRAALDAPR